jgi:hypothetical protein
MEGMGNWQKKGLILGEMFAHYGGKARLQRPLPHLPANRFLCGRASEEVGQASYAISEV